MKEGKVTDLLGISLSAVKTNLSIAKVKVPPRNSTMALVPSKSCSVPWLASSLNLNPGVFSFSLLVAQPHTRKNWSLPGSQDIIMSFLNHVLIGNSETKTFIISLNFHFLKKKYYISHCVDCNLYEFQVDLEGIYRLLLLFDQHIFLITMDSGCKSSDCLTGLLGHPPQVDHVNGIVDLDHG
jgi:hypothetical protein